MNVLPPEPWTMNVALLGRKRSRIALESDDEDLHYREERSPSLPLPSPITELKRTRTQSELDSIDVVAQKDAWPVNLDSILNSPTIPKSPATEQHAHNNVDKYKKGESIVVLCVQGNLHIHYDLLCSILPDLYALSPSLQAIVLCRDPSTHVTSTTTPFSLPLTQAVGDGYNHFVRLGLLHPLGGGHFPLDAIVVVDKMGKRRIVLPFGWGAGKHVEGPAGKGVRDVLVGMLRKCVEVLVQEG